MLNLPCWIICNVCNVQLQTTYLFHRFTISAEDGEPVQPQTTNTEFVKSMDRFIPEGMDLDTVTTLARVHFARVVIKTLDVEDSEMEKYNDW